MNLAMLAGLEDRSIGPGNRPDEMVMMLLYSNRYLASDDTALPAFTSHDAFFSRLPPSSP